MLFVTTYNSDGQLQKRGNLPLLCYQPGGDCHAIAHNDIAFKTART